MTKLYVVGSKANPMLTLSSPHATAFFQSAWLPDLDRDSKKVLAHSEVIVDVQHVSDHGVSIASPEQIETAINRLNPDLVVIPDVLRACEATLQSANEFLKVIRKVFPNPGFDFMFVPQGNTLPEWRRCLNEFFECSGWARKYITTIGIPKILHKIAPTPDFHRFELLGFIPTALKVHMLGCWGGWGEMMGHKRVASWDTSLPVAAAQRNTLLCTLQGDQKLQLLEDVEVDDPRVVLENANFLAERLDG